MIKKKSLFAIALFVLGAVSCPSARAQQSSLADEKSAEVKIDTLSGRVVNESGQPLANAAVFVRVFNSAGPGRSTTADSEGKFQVNGLDPVAYLVSASVPAYVAAPRDPEAQSTYYRVGDSVKLELIKGGVITGTVTTFTGEPVVAVRVQAYMIRDGNGQPPRYDFSFKERSTDDRGIYRIYGLAPGTYIVSAGGGGSYSSSNMNPYDSDSPTYAPGSTRDTATQINVHAGEDITNVDIRYRGEPGHAVSGIARGPQTPGAPSSLNIILTSIANGVSQWSQSGFQPAVTGGFAFNGIADGDYVLTAESFLPGGPVAVSEPRRIKVKGADITGVELIATPLGSIAGRVVLAES